MFEAKIIRSSRELTAREKIAYKSVQDATNIGTMIDQAGTGFLIEVHTAIHVHVTNDKAKNPEYDQLIIIDKDGEKFNTGSESFMNAFWDIFDELEAADALDEIITIKAIRRPSKNYDSGFITCTLV